MNKPKPNQDVFPRSNNWWDRWYNGTGMKVPVSLRTNNKKTGPKRKIHNPPVFQTRSKKEIDAIWDLYRNK